MGLFLQAAYEILRKTPFARFTVVGAGVLLPSLKELAQRLKIAWAVDFTGWVGGADLPPLLAGIDIVINPSLRAWSETFCITNIEVMSMEIPLVTYAVGGIGEYVKEPTNDVQLEEHKDYSIGENAVVVNVASPSAVASAVVHLIEMPELRRSIGRAARRTIVEGFATQRQMKQYEELYSMLHEMNAV